MLGERVNESRHQIRISDSTLVTAGELTAAPSKMKQADMGPVGKHSDFSGVD